MGVSSVVSTTGSGRKVQIQNVGVKRITGANLLAEGKRINWLYLIIDIGTLAVFENQLQDIWLGANGVPVAGNTDVLNALVPFEGQRFYNIETLQPLEYKGGAWGGASYAEYQPLAPTALIIADDDMLTVNRDHIVVAPELQLVLPSTVSASIQDGAQLRFWTLATATDVVLGVEAPFTLIDTTGNEQEFVTLVPNVNYDAYFWNGSWYLVAPEPDLDVLRPGNNLDDLEDPAEARDNLSVLSTTEVYDAIDAVGPANASLIFAGSSLEQDRTVRINFATPAEFAVGSAGKAVDPATVRNFVDAAVNEALGASEYNNISGITGDSGLFEFTTTDNLSLDYSACTLVFNTDPYLRTEPLVTVELPAGSIPAVTIVDKTFYYIVADALGNAMLVTSYDRTNPLLLRLGYCVIQNSEFIEFATMPQLASSDKSLRGAAPVALGGTINPSATGAAGTLSSGELTWTLEGVNWEFNLAKPHTYLRAYSEVITYDLLRNDSSLVASGQIYVDGQLLQDGSPVGAGQFSFQVIYEDIFGSFYIIQGTEAYATIEEAVAAALSASPAVPEFTPIHRELARVVLRGDQFFTSPSLDLTDPAKFSVLSLAVTGIGEETDENGIDWRYAAGGGLLQPGVYYFFRDSSTYTLPALTASTQFIGWRALFNQFPVVVVSNDATETITDEATGEVDTAVTIDVSGRQVVAVSDLTTWRY